jgi:hypothetical protein
MSYTCHVVHGHPDIPILETDEKILIYHLSNSSFIPVLELTADWSYRRHNSSSIPSLKLRF